MRSKIFIVLLALAIVMANAATVAAAPKWAKDDPRVAIYAPGDVHAFEYSIEMPGESSMEEVALVENDKAIRLLMVNGGFIPNAEILVYNDRILVPVRIISEALGADVSWDEETQTVSVRNLKNKLIKLVIDSEKADIDGAWHELDAPPKIYGGTTYVPLGFMAEALGAEVGYYAQYSKWPSGGDIEHPYLIVTVEKNSLTPEFTVEDGLAAAIEASKQEHENLKGYLAEVGRTFDDAFADYDPSQITYAGYNLGRYYVYKLAAANGFSVFFNSYTGGVFSEQPGLPFLNIQEGFINVSWLYQ
jgi:hypothetical protein